MAHARNWKGVQIFTVGHSTRALDELVALLRSFDISTLVDIRTIPRSRHNPQFNGDALRSSLRSRGIAYVHLPRLGGLRHARKDSQNTAWRNTSFRGFADYMQTGEFEAGLEELRALAATGRVAVMCAEAVPWRCHRSLVADALTARGAHVEHITGASRSTPHHLTPFAEVRRARVTYPSEEGTLRTRGPFHLEATVRVLQRRPTNLVDVWNEAEGRYLRALQVPGERPSLVEVTNRGTIDAPDVHYAVRSGAPSSAARTLRKVLGLDVDPSPLQRLAETERRLRPVALALRGMRPPRFTGLFETFTNVVPFQQVSLEAGMAIVGRLVERFGERIDHDGRSFHTPPTAQSIASARLDSLRSCGLSLRKAESLRHLARNIESGALTEEHLDRMSTEDALRTLTELPGIGPWSAGVVLLRGFGRLDVFPPGDAGASGGLGQLLQLPPGAPLDRALQRSGAHRGFLYFCVLGGNLLTRGLIHPAPPAGDRARSPATGTMPPSLGGHP
jgi:3-methyladenine DNA glycosylase/8-oxoguanine DNA glycosylase